MDQDSSNPVIYQNYGSLLKSQGRNDESIKIYQAGLSLYPENIGINHNYANLLRKIKPASALEKYIFLLQLHLESGNQLNNDNVCSVLSDIVSLQRELGLYQWSLLVNSNALLISNENASLVVNLMLLLDDCNLSESYNELVDSLQSQLKDFVNSVPPYKRIQILFGLATHEIQRFNPSNANNFYQEAFICAQELMDIDSDQSDDARHLITINGWNIGCNLLKMQDFEKGWKLFEHGLQTPCNGPQRWQRSLAKPFSSDELTLWRGESLIGKTILLLDEQAIGDVMMFASLLSTLVQESKTVSLFLSDRLIPIYNRHFSSQIKSNKVSIFSRKDFELGRLESGQFDYQCPIGSICQYRFTSIDSYAPSVPCLTADPIAREKLRSSYIKNAEGKRLVGLSWRGGGKSDRMKQKSIDEEDFFTFLQSIKNVRFISLQYGNCEKLVNSWNSRGIDIIYDPSVNALKDMDCWLSQVSCCDAVLSVANTTIHGAGGLNLPTLCLLSRFDDWRWFADPSIMRSYWYPSVGIARESKTLGWQTAFQQAKQWLEDGCPTTYGPNHSQ